MRACVDVGGTKVAVSLSRDSASPPMGRRSEPTATRGGNDALALQILRLIGEVCAGQGVDPASVDRVGVSSTGPFVIADGRIECASPNICGGIAGPARGLPNDWTTAPL
ncbi:MAG: ROK family protein, partial [Variovorax sp.]